MSVTTLLHQGSIIPLLSICGKIFERLIFNKMFKFFIDNDLMSPNRSGFKPGGPCTNKILSITHDFYKSFEDGLEIRGVFLIKFGVRFYYINLSKLLSPVMF